MAIPIRFSELWSWWWEGSNQRDNIARWLLTLSVALFMLAWYRWLLAKPKNKGERPLPPGPRGLPLVGSLPFLDPELHVYFADLARVYGPIAKIWLGNKLGIIITSPSMARAVLKDHDNTFANRDVPAVARIIAYGGKDIVWTPNGPEWRMLRKVCVREMLGHASLEAVYELRRQEMRATIGHVYGRSSGMAINVGEQMFLTVLNVITSMLWGGTLKGEERTSLGSEFREVVSEITEILGKPNISDFFPGLARFDLQGLGSQIKGPLVRFDRIFEMIIEQRLKMDREEKAEGKSGEKGCKDFLQFMLKLKDGGDSKTPFTMTHLKALLMVFNKWIEAMQGDLPKAILTNQDSAMTKAIKFVFPTTCHHYCLWHIMQNLQKNLGGIAIHNPNFIKTFKKIAYNSITREQFEMAWKDMLTDFDLVDNEWLHSMYGIHEMWVPTYLRDIFFGGMSTTSRSESINAFLKLYVTQKNGLYDFMLRHE